MGAKEGRLQDGACQVTHAWQLGGGGEGRGKGREEGKEVMEGVRGRGTRGGGKERLEGVRGGGKRRL